MSFQPEDALSLQCQRRIEAYRLHMNHWGRDFDQEALAAKVVRQVERNRHRLPSSPPPDSQTGIPDSYIDDIIRSLIEEGPWVQALLARESQAWARLLALIEKRMWSNLSSYRHVLMSAAPIEMLVEDMTNYCANVVWRSLSRFPYDTRLEAWVSALVAFEVSTFRRSADFKRNHKVRSLERSLLPGPEEITLADVLPDQGADHAFERLDAELTIAAGLKLLSPDQQEVVLRQLRGQTTEDIAREMGRTREAIHQLRHKAVTKLRGFLALEQEEKDGP